MKKIVGKFWKRWDFTSESEAVDKNIRVTCLDIDYDDFSEEEHSLFSDYVSELYIGQEDKGKVYVHITTAAPSVNMMWKIAKFLETRIAKTKKLTILIQYFNSDGTIAHFKIFEGSKVEVTTRFYNNYNCLILHAKEVDAEVHNNKGKKGKK